MALRWLEFSYDQGNLMKATQLLANFEDRCRVRIEGQRGKPFGKREIQWGWNERGNFTGKYAHSVNMYAMQAFHLDEGVEEANAALCELFGHYLEHETDLYEAHSFHWSGALSARLWSFFSLRYTARYGRQAGKLNVAT